MEDCLIVLVGCGPGQTLRMVILDTPSATHVPLHYMYVSESFIYYGVIRIKHKNN